MRSTIYILHMFKVAVEILSLIILTVFLSSSRSESEWTEAVEGASSGAAGSEAGMFCEGASPYRFFLAAVNCKRQISYFINKNQTGWLHTLVLQLRSSLISKI